MNAQHEALKKFGYQVEYALNHYHPHGLSASSFQHIILCGLGGSGIGGKIARSLFSRDLPLPVETVSDYHLPAYANEHTLVILGSYSGDTEETLSLYEDAKNRKCKCLVLTSGGKIQHLAEQDQLHLSLMEGGYQPRMALGFSLTYMVLILAELLGKKVEEELREIAAKVGDPHIYKEEATQIFESIKTKLKHKLVVLADGALECVGIRFAQQIFENAKHECFCHVVPEMNHNVIESYYGQIETVFFFLDSHQNDRVSTRFEFLNNLLEVENNKVINIPVEDFSITAVYEIIYMLDWLSIYIADFRRVDSLNVPNIVSLKEFLEQENA